MATTVWILSDNYLANPVESRNINIYRTNLENRNGKKTTAIAYGNYEYCDKWAHQLSGVWQTTLLWLGESFGLEALAIKDIPPKYIRIPNLVKYLVPTTNSPAAKTLRNFSDAWNAGIS